MSQLTFPCAEQHPERRLVRAPEPMACPLCLGPIPAGELCEQWLAGRLAHQLCAHQARTIRIREPDVETKR